MAGTATVRRPGWALPPQPPETWVGGLWLTVLLVSVALAVAVPVAPVWNGASRDATLLAYAHAAAAAAAVLTAFALLVQVMVIGDRWLRWAAAGYGLAAVAAVAVSVRPELLAADDLGTTAKSAWVVTAVVCAVAAVPWLRPSPGCRRWVGAGLVLAAVAAVLHALAKTPRDHLWWAGAAGAVAAFVLPAVAIGLRTALGFGRQSRRWRQLEAEVKALRRGSRLLPGRSVTPEDDEGLPSAGEVKAILDAAAVRVALQPVLELPSGAIVGSEALSRFGGRIPTDRWFKAASKSGYGAELERLCLAAALALLPTLPDNHFLAVNISPAALVDPGVLALLDATDLRRIVVEVTEHEAVEDYALTRVVLTRLRAAGARIAVDDTGAGFASLRHVLMLQPDVIKLDISLTRDVDVDRRQQALVRAVTAFSAQVGATVLAEGVETQAQLDTLRDIGVQLGQGWHLGVPVLAT